MAESNVTKYVTLDSLQHFYHLLRSGEFKASQTHYGGIRLGTALAWSGDDNSTDSTVGVVVGNGLNDANGVLTLDLPVATKDALGGVKLGTALNMNSDGQLGVAIGAGLQTTTDGSSLILSKATENTLGGIKVGENLSISEDGTLSAEEGVSIESITYSELKSLRDNSQLTPGRKYRITDYACSGTGQSMSVMNHPFDIIVEALTENKLSENAKATQPSNDIGTLINSNLIKFTDINGWKSLDISSGAPQPILNIAAISTEGKVAYDRAKYSGLNPGTVIKVSFTGYVGDYNNASVQKPITGLGVVLADQDDTEILAYDYGYNKEAYYITMPDSITSNTSYYIKFYADGSNKEAIDGVCGVKGEVYSGTPYFENNDLNKWDLKYSLDRDGFNWPSLDDNVFKGVIYYMKDDFNNEAHYDFKNILFPVTINGSSKYYYTFSYVNNESVYDATVVTDKCFENKIKGTYDIDGIQRLNKIVFINEDFGSNTNCSFNSFDGYCNDIVFGHACCSNTFGCYCANNSFGDYCSFNTFGNHFGGLNGGGNTFGNYCQSNTFGINCDKNTFGNYTFNNTFGKKCQNCKFTNAASNGSLLEACKRITIGDECNNLNLYNTEGPSYSGNKFLQNIEVNPGLTGNVKISGLNTAYKQVVAKDSDGQIVVYIDGESTYELQPASSEYEADPKLGGIIIGTGFDYDTNTGKLNLCAASDTQLGGIKVGANLSISEDGTLSAEASAGASIESITYSALKSLRDNSQLVPGRRYRIVDYTTRTTAENTKSASWNFDLIVEATSENTLSEDAKAIRCYNTKREHGAKKENKFTFSDINNWKVYGGTESYGPTLPQEILSLVGSDQICTEIATRDIEADTIVKVTLIGTDSTGNSIRGFGAALIQGGTIIDQDFGPNRQEYYLQAPTNGSYVIRFYALGAKADLDSGICGAQADSFYTTAHFENSNLEAWEIKYDLDNDTNKYEWADVENGMGVIYRMIDDRNNDCPYDFKNVLFYNEKLTTNTTTDKYYYTFSYIIDGVLHDGTVNEQVECYGNSMGVYLKGNKKCLNSNIFRNTSTEGDCYSNTFGDNCSSNTFGNKCTKNIFGDECKNNTFGNTCSSNIFGAHSYSNTFGDSCTYITFGAGCYLNSFGNSCKYNKFGDYCFSNSFGNSCNYNTFGAYCQNNTFGNSCSNNSFGNSCSSNNFGASCVRNTFGVNCQNNTFGDKCNDNKFGNSCQSNEFTGNCIKNTFEVFCCSSTFGDSCKYNKFGHECNDNTFGDYCQNIEFENNCSNINLNSSATTSDSNYLQNIRITNKIEGSDTTPLTITADPSSSRNLVVTKDAVGNIIQYFEGENTYELPSATDQTLGGIKVAKVADTTSSIVEGSGTNYGVKVNSNGLAYVSVPASSSSSYTLEPATTDTLGGIIVGDNLSVAADGTLSVAVGNGLNDDDNVLALDTATASNIGGIKVQSVNTASTDVEVGKGIHYGVKLNSTGLAYVDVPSSSYSLPTATDQALGGIKVYETTNVDTTNIASGSGTTHYGVKVNGSGLAYVDVPTSSSSDYELSKATKNDLGGIKVIDDSQSTLIPDNYISATNNGNGTYYGVKVNQAGYAYVSVPTSTSSSDYELPEASDQTLGGIRLGTALKWSDQDQVGVVVGEGLSSTNAGGGIKLTKANTGALGGIKVQSASTSTSNDVTVIDGSGTHYGVKLNSTGLAYVSVPEASLSVTDIPLGDGIYRDSNNNNALTLSKALASTLGGIKVKSSNTSVANSNIVSGSGTNYGVKVNSNGLAYVSVPTEVYELPEATTSTLGGIRLGTALEATGGDNSTVGVVVGDGLETTNGGSLILSSATATSIGGIKLGTAMGKTSDGKVGVSIGAGLGLDGGSLKVNTSGSFDSKEISGGNTVARVYVPVKIDTDGNLYVTFSLSTAVVFE